MRISGAMNADHNDDNLLSDNQPVERWYFIE